jgi:branched-chain amino acid transport system permease protein
VSATAFAQITLDGLLLGGVYALSALGFTMIFGVMRVVNLAHGSFVVLAALLAAWAYAQVHVSPLLVLPAAVAIAFVLGAAIHRVLLRRLPAEVASQEATSLTLTFGLSYFLAGAGLAVFGGTFRAVPYLTGAFHLGPLAIGQARLLAFVVAAVLTALLALYLRATTTGRAIRATSQHVEGAQACGIDVDGVRTFAFALGSAIAAASGCLLSLIYTLNPEMGDVFTLNAFAVVAIGGLGSYTGALAGAAILGLASSYVAYFANAQLAEAAPYVIFILVLLVLPAGLMGKRAA